MYSFKTAQNIKENLSRYIGKPISSVDDSILINRVSIIQFDNQEIDFDILGENEDLFNQSGNTFKVWLIHDLDIDEIFRDSKEFCADFNIAL